MEQKHFGVWLIKAVPAKYMEKLKKVNIYKNDREGESMTYEEAVQMIPPGKYRHFKGNEYEVIGIARHSENESPMVVYKALYGDGSLWTRPADMWNETVNRDGKSCRRFEKV